jgi:hypothetical protein
MEVNKSNGLFGREKLGTPKPLGVVQDCICQPSSFFFLHASADTYVHTVLRRTRPEPMTTRCHAAVPKL